MNNSKLALEAIKDADIAGAGLSSAAGLTYSGQRAFCQVPFFIYGRFFEI